MFAKAKYPIALDIGSHAVKLVQFERKKKGLSLSRLGMASLASGAVVDGTVRDHEEVMRAVDELIAAERAKMKEVVVSVSGSAAVVSTLLVPTMKGASLDEAVDAEAVQILPFPLEEARITRRRLGKITVDGQAMEEFLLVAVQREALEEMVELLRHLELEPKIVDVNLLAMENAHFHAGGKREEGVTALVDIGASSTLVHILREGRTLLTRMIPFGGVAVTKALAERFSVTQFEAEQIKLGAKPASSPRAAVEVIRGEVERLALEFGRTFQLLWDLRSEERVARIILSGGGAHLEGLPAFLSASLDLPIQMADPFKNVEIPENIFDPDYVEAIAPVAAISAGLAFRGVDAA